MAAVYYRCTSEDDIYVQAVTGLILDMLDQPRQLPPPAIYKWIYISNFETFSWDLFYVIPNLVTEKNTFGNYFYELDKKKKSRALIS